METYRGICLTLQSVAVLDNLVSGVDSRLELIPDIGLITFRTKVYYLTRLLISPYEVLALLRVLVPILIKPPVDLTLVSIGVFASVA